METEPAGWVGESGGGYEKEKKQEKLRLKQNYGFLRGTSLVIGTIIGSGIFIVPQNILMLTGSVGVSLLIWASGGLISFLGVLTSAELGSLASKSGMVYAYLYECYGPVLSFLFVWTSVTVIQPSMQAVAALTFSHYLMALFPICGGPPVLPVKLCAVAVIVTLALINCHSTRVSAPVQMACTLLKVLALLLIVFWGIVRLAQGHTSEFDNGFQGTTTEVSDIALAFYSINFSYSGWENIYMIFEEVKNPKRNLIACGGVGLLVVTTLYVLANVSFLTAISHTQLLTSPAVAVTWGNVILGSASLLIPLSVLISVFGSSTGVVFSSARVTHAAARDKTMPEFLSFIHVNKYSPVPAIMLSSALAVIFVLPADIGNIINFLSLPMAVFGLLSDIALCIFRKTRPNAARFIKTPLVVPALSIAYNLFLIVMPVALSPKLEFLYAVCFVLAGLLLYVPFVSFNLRPKVLDKVEECLQMLLQVVPTSYSKVD